MQLKYIKDRCLICNLCRDTNLCTAEAVLQKPEGIVHFFEPSQGNHHFFTPIFVVSLKAIAILSILSR